MDRNALLLYLQNVRDLEVARYGLRVQYGRENQHYQNQIRQLQKTNLRELPSEPSGAFETIVFGFFAVASLFFTIVLFATRGNSDLATLCAWICLILTIVFGIATAKYFLDDQSEREKYKSEYYAALNHNQCEKERVRKNKDKISTLQAQWNSRSAWYQQEIEKLDRLLKDFYSMNIIPAQFRTVSAACYIYDYMSTSQETLTTALFDQHLEDGIQRLEAKLDTIIGQLEDILYETRCMRAENQRAIERTIHQNNQMLQSLQRTEQNTLASAQYAELAANYSKANAYFSLATYLKQ